MNKIDWGAIKIIGIALMIASIGIDRNLGNPTIWTDIMFFLGLGGSLYAIYKSNT